MSDTESRKRAMSGEGDHIVPRKRERSPDSSTDLHLDTIFRFLPDKPDDEHYKRSMKHLVHGIVDANDLQHSATEPLDKVLRVIDERCADECAAKTTLISAVREYYAAFFLGQPPRLCTSSSLARPSKAINIGTEVELKITPTAQAEESVEEPAKKRRRKQAKPFTLPGQRVRDERRRGVKGYELLKFLQEDDDNAVVLRLGDNLGSDGPPTQGSRAQHATRQSQQPRAASVSSDSDQQAPIVLRNHLMYTEHNPFVALDQTLDGYPDLPNAAASLVLHPVGSHGPAEPAPGEDEIRKHLHTRLAANGGFCDVEQMALTASSRSGLLKSFDATFLVSFVDADYATRAQGLHMYAWPTMFRLDKLQTGPHHTYLCREVTADDVGAKRADTLLSLLGCFDRGSTMCVKMATEEETGFVMVQLSEPSHLRSFSFSLGSRQGSGQTIRLQFSPLDSNSKANCIVCKSPHHSTETCPLFATVLLETKTGVHPQFMVPDTDPADDDSGRALPLRLKRPMTDRHIQDLNQMTAHRQQLPGKDASEPRMKLENGTQSDTATAVQCDVVVIPDHTDDVDKCHCLRIASAVEFPELRYPTQHLALVPWGGNKTTAECGKKAAQKAFKTLDIAGGTYQGFRERCANGRLLPMFKNASCAAQMEGREIQVPLGIFRLTKMNYDHHITFVCDNIPFGSEGVGRSQMLHGLLHSFPAQRYLRVQVAATSESTNSSAWTGIMVVSFSVRKLMESFQFDVSLRGYHQGRSGFWTAVFHAANTGHGLPCKACGSCNHSTEFCPNLKPMVLTTASGTHHPRMRT